MCTATPSSDRFESLSCARGTAVRDPRSPPRGATGRKSALQVSRPGFPAIKAATSHNRLTFTSRLFTRFLPLAGTGLPSRRPASREVACQARHASSQASSTALAYGAAGPQLPGPRVDLCRWHAARCSRTCFMTFFICRPPCHSNAAIGSRRHTQTFCQLNLTSKIAT